MKKFLAVLLSVLCTVGIAGTLGLAGCKKDSHSHVFDKQVLGEDYLAAEATCTEGTKYYYSCKCGAKGVCTFEIGNPLGHSFTSYVSDNNATCTQDGTKTAKCDRCDETDTVKNVDSKLGHKFTNYVSDNNATCTQDGTKTAKCDRCDETDTIIDEGSKLEHSYTEQAVSDKYILPLPQPALKKQRITILANAEQRERVRLKPAIRSGTIM